MCQGEKGAAEGTTPLSFLSDVSVQSAEELMRTPEPDDSPESPTMTYSFESFVEALEGDSATALFSASSNVNESDEDSGSSTLPMSPYPYGMVEHVTLDESVSGRVDYTTWTRGTEDVSDAGRFLDDVISFHYNYNGHGHGFGGPPSPLNSMPFTFEASSSLNHEHELAAFSFHLEFDSLEAALRVPEPLTTYGYTRQQELLGYFCEKPAWKWRPPPGLPHPPLLPFVPEDLFKFEAEAKAGDYFDFFLDESIIIDPIMKMGENNFPILVLQHLTGFKIVGKPDWDILEMLMYY